MELIKVTEENGEQLVSARDLHKFLEITERFNNWFERQLQYGFEENVDFTGCKFFNEKANKELQDYSISLNMAKEICYKQKTNKKAGLLLKKLGSDLTHIHTFSRFEKSFEYCIVEFLGELEIKIIKQYKVEKYYIDFYLPDFNIAIEYDEKHHLSYKNIKKDSERQKYIEKKYNLKFIRCDYRDSDLKNLAEIVKEIK